MQITHLNEANFHQEVSDASVPVLVDFWAQWCMPCLMVAPVLEEIAKDYEGKIRICKLNVDEAPSIASEYGIMSIPTMIIFKDGKPQSKIVGALPKRELEKFIAPYIS